MTFKIFGMKIGISYCSLKYYSIRSFNQWMWFYKPYKNVKGFIFRIFGVYFNIREKNASEKLLQLWKMKHPWLYKPRDEFNFDSN